MKWIERYKRNRQEKSLMNEYMNILKKCKGTFKKSIGITKIGDIVHKIEVNGIEIESRDPLFIKEL